MKVAIPRVPGALVFALLAAALASACVKIEDGPPGTSDSALAAATLLYEHEQTDK